MKLSTLIGQTLDEKYFIDKQLGKGGMGAVFLATHIGTGRPVAVKVIAPQFMTNDEFVERFKREAKAAGRLRHPNVVNVTDFGFASLSANRLAYLVMEYLDGCSLGDILAEERRLPVEWVVDILEQVCSAVDEAHKQGIVHRDLKPDNIWLEPNRRGGYTIKVLDFGLAKLGDPTSPDTASQTNAGESLSANSLPPQTGQETQVGLNDQANTIAQSKQTQVMEVNTVFQPVNDEEAQTRIRHQEAQTHLLENAETLAGEEAVTQLHQDFGGAATRLQQVSADETETRIFSPSGDEDAETRIMPTPGERGSTTNSLNNAASVKSGGLHSDWYVSSLADSTDGLTRVGSVLGTPLYMSPEQCAGMPLDARTDVYSLGVIAYQMLTGTTPFEGDMVTVMKHHSETNPPPFKEKQIKTTRKRKYQIPKRTEKLVLSALAKNPDERPQSAMAFADMLRTSAEGAGALFRRAVALYGEYFNKFFIVSLLVNIPGVILLGLQVLSTILLRSYDVQHWKVITTESAFSLVKIVLSFFSTSVLAGVTVWLVTQLMLAPLRPIRIRKAFAAVKKKARPFFKTSAMVSLLSMLGLILCLVPGFILMTFYVLTLPVVMMENVSGRAAMRRSKELAKRSLGTVIFVVLIQFGIPFIYSAVINSMIVTIGKTAQIDRIIQQRAIDIFRLPVDILLIPLVAIMTALLYLKMRQAGGENVNESLSRFEEEDAPQTKWQKRMRDRVSISTQPSK
ncbi:MAG: protein kinase [Acidobacteriota bacterium]